MKSINLLVVDFDSFFPTFGAGLSPALYDWSHKEAPFFMIDIWEQRAANFFLAGDPLPELDGSQRDFWRRFNFARDARLYVADSNSRAVLREVAQDVRRVTLIDAHHDSGYGNGRELQQQFRATCDNWMLFYQGAQRLVVYPQWMQGRWRDPEPEHRVRRIDANAFDAKAYQYHRVFLCRSSAWVPPWFDAAFDQFVAEFPGKAVYVDPAEYPAKASERRPFDAGSALGMAADMNRVLLAARDMRIPPALIVPA